MSSPDHDITAGDLIRPRGEHDDLTFEQFDRTFSYNTISDRRVVFVRLILKELDKRSRPNRVLDIGCGTGISESGQSHLFTRAIAEHADEFWGIEPDISLSPQPGIFDHFQHAHMETAEVPPASIDVAYSFMVMEHVANPLAFLQAVRRALKPGGSYLFLTPNGRHLFTILSGTLHKLKLDELVLRMIRGKLTEQYHYPIENKCQTPRVINRLAARTGFTPPEYAFMERYGMYNYFKGPLRPLLWVMDARRRIGRNPRCLLNLTCRLTKPH